MKTTKRTITTLFSYRFGLSGAACAVLLSVLLFPSVSSAMTQKLGCAKYELESGDLNCYFYADKSPLVGGIVTVYAGFYPATSTILINSTSQALAAVPTNDYAHFAQNQNWVYETGTNTYYIDLKWNGTDYDTSKEPYAKITTDVVVCSALDVGCYFSQALVYVFYPSEASIDRFVSLKDTASTTWPFSYVYELPVFLSELYPTGTSTFSIGVPWHVGSASSTLVLLSTDKIEAVPYVGTFRTLIGYALWLMTVLTVYTIVLQIHNQNTRPV